MYCIVEFDVGDRTEIEIVPASWYDDKLRKCWWPPTSRNTCKMVINQVSPDQQTWKQYDAICTGKISIITTIYIYICNFNIITIIISKKVLNRFFINLENFFR